MLGSFLIVALLGAFSVGQANFTTTIRTTTTTTAIRTTTTTTTTRTTTTTTSTTSTTSKTSTTATGTNPLKSAWRIVARTSSPGGSWVVRRVKFLTKDGELSPGAPGSKCQVISSSEPRSKRAFDDGLRGFWRGRKSNGIFFIGLTCDMPDMSITGVTLTQREVHTASTVTVQKLDPLQGWTDVAISTQVAKNQEVLLYGTNLRSSAWRIVASTSSPGLAWDVERVKFLTNEGELSPDSKCQVITSGEGGRNSQGKQAFRDSRKRFWEGRKSNGMFFIGLTCAMPDMPIISVSVKQRGVNTASTVKVQKLDSSQGWSDVATATQVHPFETTALYERAERRLQTELMV